MNPDIEQAARQLIESFAKAQPAAIAAFSALAQATFADGALDVKTKELIALGIAIAQGCDGCIAWHNAALQRLGASPEEIAEVGTVAVEMGAGIALYRSAKALEGYREF
ncbi:MAG: carboxymuconolactone decarboxylase family protein [Gammaproteobacteria bacterium]|nr:carboxymuconolactone decarboxylase family protein [Gammaproteobacteria bacterium]